MNSKILLSVVAAAALSLLTACGGGDAAEDNAANRAAPTAVADTGGIGGSGVATQSGVRNPADLIGGIGGSGAPAPHVGGIGGSGILLVGRASTCSASVPVTLVGARVNPNAAAQPAAAGWLTAAMAAPVRIDLATLVAGQTLSVDFSAIPDGTYRQLRLLQVGADSDGQGQDSGSDNSQGAQGGPRLAASITVMQGRATGSVDLTNVCGSVAATARTAADDASTTED